MSDREYKLRSAGTRTSEGNLIVDVGMWECGEIKQGVSLRFEHGRGGFVVDFDDLRLAVEAADRIRKQAKQEAA